MLSQNCYCRDLYICQIIANNNSNRVFVGSEFDSVGVALNGRGFCEPACPHKKHSLYSALLSLTIVTLQ